MSAGVRSRRAEGEPDRLIVLVQKPRVLARPSAAAGGLNRIQRLRELTVTELIPAFEELKEKYAGRDVAFVVKYLHADGRIIATRPKVLRVPVSGTQTIEG
ncbi:MAG: hypothetical protein IH897_14685 [Planctomycetes bacterium]|nr:hypothetical protein [Planctomycetota bacterium]